MPRPSTRSLAVEIPRIIEVQAVGKSAKRSQLPAVLLFRPTSASRCAIAPVSFSDQPRKQLILEENPKYFLNARHRGTAPGLLVHPSCTPQNVSALLAMYPLGDIRRLGSSTEHPARSSKARSFQHAFTRPQRWAR
jgi:hypothetical protein